MPDWQIKPHIRREFRDGEWIEIPVPGHIKRTKADTMTDNIKQAEEAMGFEADTRINLLTEPKTEPHGPGQRSYQRHVAIEWEGGVIWLNMFDFVIGYEGDSPHYCIDIRQFNSAGKVKGEGVFTMARQTQRGEIPNNPEGNVKGHGWNGGYVVSILTDPDGDEAYTDNERE
jgi:hypothetical protein